MEVEAGSPLWPDSPAPLPGGSAFRRRYSRRDHALRAQDAARTIDLAHGYTGSSRRHYIPLLGHELARALKEDVILCLQVALLPDFPESGDN